MPPFFRTLRFRIAAAFFVWTAILQLALSLALPTARQSFVLNQVDEKLGRLAATLLPEIRANGAQIDPAILRTLGLSLDSNRKFVVVRTEDGSVLFAEPQGPSPALPFDPAAPRINNPVFGTTAHLYAGGSRDRERLRYATYLATPPASSAAPTPRPLYLQIASSLAMEDHLQASIDRVLLVALLLGLAGSAAAGWILSGVIVSRIERVAKAVRDVSPTRLDERIDLPTGPDEIGQMAADVNHMLERMAVAFRSQERFMSEVSHELKTPVSALLTESQVLKQSRHTPRSAAPGALANGSAQATADQRKLLEPYERFVLSVEEETRWLGKMVESFLMLARFGHGRQFLAEGLVAVNDVVLDAVEHSSLYARQHGVTVALTLHDPGQSDPDAVVRGDAELLRVVADNLIRNAVQFSKRGDTVTVRVELNRAATPETVELTVKDQGPGVPPEYLSRIFDRFAQAPGKSSTRRGSGLGLTIAKSIVDLHTGTIEARNDPTGGCIFRVRIPAEAPPPPALAPPALTAAPVV